MRFRTIVNNKILFTDSMPLGNNVAKLAYVNGIELYASLGNGKGGDTFRYWDNNNEFWAYPKEALELKYGIVGTTIKETNKFYPLESFGIFEIIGISLGDTLAQHFSSIQQDWFD